VLQHEDTLENEPMNIARLGERDASDFSAMRPQLIDHGIVRRSAGIDEDIPIRPIIFLQSLILQDHTRSIFSIGGIMRRLQAIDKGAALQIKRIGDRNPIDR